MTDQRDGSERYETVDDVLGDPSGRYFGIGYRSVQHRIFDLRVDTKGRTARAVAQVLYPQAWSTRGGRELTPHLSSIDGFVIGSQLAEAFLREAYGLDDGSARDAWISCFTIKSGPAPTTDLEHIPAALSLVGTHADPSTLCGFRSDFRIKVGSLSVELTVDHPVFVERRVNVVFADVTSCLGDGAERYLAGGYKHTRVSVRRVTMKPSLGRAHAQIDLAYASGHGCDGLSGRYLPFISIPDALVGTAQLAQAVLYRHDDLTRAASGTMWMRKIAVTVSCPVQDASFDVETWISRASVVPIGKRRLRTASFEVVLPSMTAEFSLALELPSEAAAAPTEQAMAEAV